MFPVFGQHSMPHRPAEQAGVLLHSAVSGFEDHTGYVFARIRVRTVSRDPTEQICLDLVEAGLELGLVVEGRDHDMTSLVPIRVTAVDPHHKPAKAVIVGVDLGHRLENRDLRRTAATFRWRVM